MILPAAVWAELVEAARFAAPVEACGLLAGKNGKVTRFYPMTNADASPEHFSLLPAEQFAAVKDMRARGLEMLAVWHSHPATMARMSDEDLRLAFTPDLVHVILSLSSPAGPVLRAYRVTGGTAQEVQIEVTDANADRDR